MNGTSSKPDVWDADMLMGKTGPEAGKGGANVIKENPMLWGRAGHLTKEQVDCYMRFKEQVEKRGSDFKDTVYCFTEEEGEVWALLRWLRARKFDYQEVVKMVEEATECRAEAKSTEFYKDPKKALGCDMALYMAQFPQLYSGYDKNGIPLFFSKPGVLNIDAVECITTLDGILKFHWFFMMHDFGDLLRAQKKNREGFHRFEAVCVLDLAKLSVTQLGSRTMAIIKEQAAIDSLCFPETMSRMVIINAPTFFSATWRIIKGWIDPRTAAKVDVISSRSSWEKRLKELAPIDQIPSDYGGAGPSTVETLNAASPGDMKRLYTEVLYVRGHNSVKTEVHEGEEVDVIVWTRCVSGAKFSITDQDKKMPSFVEGVEVKHTGGHEVADMPTETKLTTKRVKGPAKIKVKADSHASRFTTEKFLVAFCVY